MQLNGKSIGLIRKNMSEFEYHLIAKTSKNQSKFDCNWLN